MKIADIPKTIAKALDTNYTLRPLCLILKLFSLSYNLHHETKNLAIWHLAKISFTSTIFGIVNFCGLYLKVFQLYHIITESMRLMDCMNCVYDYIQYMVDLYFVYKYGRIISVEYFEQYKTIDMILGNIYNKAIRKRLEKITIFFAIIWTTSSICDYTAWRIHQGWLSISTVYCIDYVFLLIKIITVLDLTSHVMQIEFRLRVICDLIQDYYNASEALPDSIWVGTSRSKWFHSDTRIHVTELRPLLGRLKKLSHVDYHEIKWLSRCYVLLIEQCAFINTMYGIRLLLNSLSLLINMVSFSNVAVRLLIAPEFAIPAWESAKYFPMASSIIRLLVCSAVLFCMVVHCERTYRQGERIVYVIDHLLVNKSPGPKLRTALVELRSLVQSRPISFHMGNMVRLQYSLLVSVASVVVTYTIILLQNIT